MTNGLKLLPSAERFGVYTEFERRRAPCRANDRRLSARLTKRVDLAKVERPLQRLYQRQQVDNVRPLPIGQNSLRTTLQSA
jgi:hypothetical protein